MLLEMNRLALMKPSVQTMRSANSVIGNMCKPKCLSIFQIAMHADAKPLLAFLQDEDGRDSADFCPDRAASSDEEVCHSPVEGPRGDCNCLL